MSSATLKVHNNGLTKVNLPNKSNQQIADNSEPQTILVDEVPPSVGTKSNIKWKDNLSTPLIESELIQEKVKDSEKSKELSKNQTDQNSSSSLLKEQDITFFQRIVNVKKGKKTIFNITHNFKIIQVLPIALTDDGLYSLQEGSILEMIHQDVGLEHLADLKNKQINITMDVNVEKAHSGFYKLKIIPKSYKLINNANRSQRFDNIQDAKLNLVQELEKIRVVDEETEQKSQQVKAPSEIRPISETSLNKVSFTLESTEKASTENMYHKTNQKNQTLRTNITPLGKRVERPTTAADLIFSKNTNTGSGQVVKKQISEGSEGVKQIKNIVPSKKVNLNQPILKLGDIKVSKPEIEEDDDDEWGDPDFEKRGYTSMVDTTGEKQFGGIFTKDKSQEQLRNEYLKSIADPIFQDHSREVANKNPEIEDEELDQEIISHEDNVDPALQAELDYEESFKQQTGSTQTPSRLPFTPEQIQAIKDGTQIEEISNIDEIELIIEKDDTNEKEKSKIQPIEAQINPIELSKTKWSYAKILPKIQAAQNQFKVLSKLERKIQELEDIQERKRLRDINAENKVINIQKNVLGIIGPKVSPQEKNHEKASNKINRMKSNAARTITIEQTKPLFERSKTPEQAKKQTEEILEHLKRNLHDKNALKIKAAQESKEKHEIFSLDTAFIVFDENEIFKKFRILKEPMPDKQVNAIMNQRIDNWYYRSLKNFQFGIKEDDLNFHFSQIKLRTQRKYRNELKAS